ncbi:hypothetical protein BT63DRAFT_267691 [Microthyrium microscopicum]|uniref:BTB domain-containing protein n=1 Tax=Microthyrium microscopicum TaxID=703497 RepID=A0A6A6UE75_9PEZI|nr:hypothetical protein BT63DRAFT_267691 [Microthyrium microscopicum]
MMATITIEFCSDADVRLTMAGEEINTGAQVASISKASEAEVNGQAKDVEVVNADLDGATAAPALPPVVPPAIPKSFKKHKMGLLELEVKESRFLVSSARLIASSQYWSSMLSGPSFREGLELKEKGSVKIDLDDDPTAMMIILGIMHDNSAHVPDKVDWKTLYLIAVITDKYRWHKLVAPHAHAWLEAFGAPKIYNDSTLTLLWMAWVFGDSEQFQALSGFIVLWITEPIDESLQTNRVPDKILRAINKKREEVFQYIESAFEKYQDDLLHDSPTGFQKALQASPEHNMLRCMAHGYGILCARELQIGDDAEPDHKGVSIRLLKHNISMYRSIDTFELRYKKSTSNVPGHWDLKTILKNAIGELVLTNFGLDYEKFQPTI